MAPEKTTADEVELAPEAVQAYVACLRWVNEGGLGSVCLLAYGAGATSPYIATADRHVSDVGPFVHLQAGATSPSEAFVRLAEKVGRFENEAVVA